LRSRYRAISGVALLLGLVGGRSVGFGQGAPENVASLYLPLALHGDLQARSFAPPEARADVVAQFGGQIDAVAADERRVYVGVGSRVVILDAASPIPAAPIGQSAMLPGMIESLLLADGGLFAVAGGGLYRFDLDSSDSLPATPILGGGVHGDVVADGRQLFVAAVREGALRRSIEGPILLRLDLDRPPAAPLVDTLDLGAFAVALVADGPYVYAVTSTGNPDAVTGLQVVDATDPNALRVVATVDMAEPPRDVGQRGDLLYVTSDSGITVIDVSSPIAPRVLGRVDASYAGSLAVGEHYLAVSVFLAVSLFSLEEPSQPRPVSSIGGVAWPRVAGPRWLYATGLDGLQRVDVRTLQAPTADVWLPPEAVNSVRVAVGEDAAVVVDDYLPPVTFLRLDPPLSAPTTIGRDFDKAEDVAIDGHYLFIAGSVGLDVWDLNDSAAQAPVGSLEEFRHSNRRLLVDENRLFACDGDRLEVLDISAPTRPTLVGTIEGWDFEDCAIDGARVALRAAGGVEVIDLADPSSPVVLDSVRVDQAFWVRSVALRDGLLAVVVGQDLPISSYPAIVRYELLLFDLSVPHELRRPARIAITDMTEYERDALRRSAVGFAGNVVYVVLSVSDYEPYPGRIFYIDVGEPSLPRLAAVQQTLGQAIEVEMAGRRAYVAEGLSGLSVLDWPKEVPGP